MNFYNLLKLIPREAFTTQVKKATKEMFPEVVEKSVVEDGPTDKAILLASIIKNGDFGCKKSSIIQICEALSGEKIKPLFEKAQQEENYIQPVLYACYVHTAETNNYSPDHRFIILDLESENRGIKFGDIEYTDFWNLDGNYANDTRAATDAEIEEFMNEIYDSLKEEE